MNKPVTYQTLLLWLAVVFAVMGLCYNAPWRQGGAEAIAPIPAVDQDGALVGNEEALGTDSTTVIYRDGAFHPARLDIAVGTSVVFMNQSERPVWPASNIHPTHAILSTFDPLEAIWPGESWTYLFERGGYWRYHNHLEPSETGIVVALGGLEQKRTLPALAEDMRPLSFPPMPDSAKDEYDLRYEHELREFITLYGPQAAIGVLYEDQSLTGRDCHDPAHVAGRIAYETFGPAAATVVVHECQAGLQHGVIEALFAERGTAHLSQDIADVCGASANAFIRHQCLHGIGHGLMAWTSYEIHEALELCDHSLTGVDKPSCYSGVFMENVVGGSSGAMGHITEYLKPDDPHFPCDAIAEDYVAHCYFYQTTHMIKVFGGDYPKIALACLEAPNFNAQWLCYSSYGRDVHAFVDGDAERSIELCGHAPAGDLRKSCLSGAVQNGFWDPGGASESIAFCALLEDDPDGQDGCYEIIIDRAPQVISDTTALRDFCTQLPESRQQHCLGITGS